MMVSLLYPSSETQWDSAPDSGWEARASDLELEHLLNAMSADHPEIAEVCRHVLNTSLQSPEEIRYRQEILQDFLAQPALLLRLYDRCTAAEEKRRSSWYRLTSPHLSTTYSSAADLLKIYLEALVQIRKEVENQPFSSAGLRRFSAVLAQELSDQYLDRLRKLEPGITEEDSILISAGFGPFLQGVSYTKRQKRKGISRLQWLLLPSYTIADRDMNGAADLGIRRDRAINEAANAMAQAADNLEQFLNNLRKELAFYVGALHLFDRFRQLQLPVCFPVLTGGHHRLWENLYDGSLALITCGAVVGNTMESSDQTHYLITGANQGGKTTFLRSVGQCQLMAQCGLFVCAKRCQLPLMRVIATHFKREEDAQMDSGKLDEELARMSCIIDHMKSGGMLLSNESFSSTNDLEGSDILSQITQALLERNVEVFTVTHLINYAMTCENAPQTLCLRAERKENGERTFRLVRGRPLQTAFGEDLYDKIFGEEKG